MPQIHPLPLRFPQSAMGKSKKCDFCFCKKLFDGARSPLFGKAEGFRQQGSRKSQRSEIFGKRRSGVRMRALPPSGRCERAADCSDEGALTEKRGFRTRDLIIEKGLVKISAGCCLRFLRWEDNPIALAMLGTKEVFLCAAPYRAHHYRSAAHSPFLQQAKYCQIGLRCGKV